MNEWKALEPAEFHTVAGLDALKQSIGDIRDKTKFGTPARRVADEVYHAIKKTIVDHDPEYARVMKDYERASELLKEIEGDLALGNKQRASTALAKFQTALRKDVSSRFGARKARVDTLEQAGARGLTTSLAGQAMNSLAPRGLSRMAGTMGMGGAAVFNPSSLPAMMALGATMSPRLVGEAVHGAGRVAGPAMGAMSRVPSGAPMASFQAGRAGRAGSEEEALRTQLAQLLAR